MTSILVTGANGQLGSELKDLSTQYPHFQFIWTDLAELDLTSQPAIQAFFQKNKIDYCLNCAAYTAVDKAESHPEIAHTVNAVAPSYLAEACATNQARMIHISTDYVYHNNQNTPYKEGDPTDPKGVYAATKLDGDNRVLASGAHTMVIRTSWVYSRFGNNFVKTMLRLGTEREELGVIFDQIGTPTYAHDLAKAMLTIIEKTENGGVDPDLFSGLYHFSNEGIGSWYDFAKAIFDIRGIECRLRPIETYEYPTPAARPPFSVLNKSKIKNAFGLTIPHWRDSLTNCLSLLTPKT